MDFAYKQHFTLCHLKTHPILSILYILYSIGTLCSKIDNENTKFFLMDLSESGFTFLPGALSWTDWFTMAYKNVTVTWNLVYEEYIAG